MADDIAHLGLAVDSSQVKTATSDLDKFTEASKKAEKAAGDLSKAGGNADGVRKPLEDSAKASAGLADSLGATRVAALSAVSALGAMTAGALAFGTGALLVSQYWQAGQRDIERALAGIGQRTGETVKSVSQFSRENASLTGLSVTQARTAALELVKTGNIAVSNLRGLGDAIHGYAVMTGTDAKKATEAFSNALSGDLVKGAEKLNQTYGTMNSATFEQIKLLEMAGNRTAAAQVIIDSMQKSNLKAADTVSLLGKGYQALSNVLDRIANGPAQADSPDAGIMERQIAALQKQRDAIAALPGGSTKVLDDLNQKIADLQKKMSEANAGPLEKQLNGLSAAAHATVEAFIPQLDQIKKLKEAQDALVAARDTPGVNSNLERDNTALQAIQVQVRLLEDSAAATARMNDKTLELAGTYKGYSLEVARTLDVQKGQLAIAQAVTLQEKMAAQEAEQRRRLIFDQGMQPNEAAAVAAGNRAQAEAQIKSQLQAQLLAMQDQLAIAQAVTGQQLLSAQADATRNQIIRDTGDAMLATQTAAMQREIAEARINAQIQNQVEGLDQQRRMINAVANGTGAATAAAIAYENAIRAGANETEAAALKSAVLAANMAKVAAASRDASNAAHFAAGGSQAFGNQWGNQEVGLPGTSGSDSQRAAWDAAYGAGNYNTFINGGFGISGGRFDVMARPTDAGLQNQYSQALNNAAMSQMDDITRAKFKAGSYQIPQAQAEAIANAYLTRMNLENSPNAQKAAADFIGKAESPSSSTSNSLINPMWSSGSSNVIGFRAANGIDFTVPGTGPTDSVRVSGLVSPGERMIVVPPGGQPPANSNGAGNTRASRPISQSITIQAASLRGASDTMPQLAARMARAAAAAARHR